MKREHFGVFFARAEAALVADNGLTPHLEALLARANEDVVPAGRAIVQGLHIKSMQLSATLNLCAHQ